METSALQILGENVKRLREAQGWSQPDLARRSGVAQTTISAIETQKQKASIEKVEMLAKAFRVPTWALLMPNLDPSLFQGNGLGKVVDDYIQVPPESRLEICRIAEREMRYMVINAKKT